MNNNYYQKPIDYGEENTNIINEYRKKETNKNNSYIDIFNINIGKIVDVHMSFNNSNSDTKSIFNGVLESANDNYIIISEPKTGKWTMLILDYLDYVVFEEEINYR